MDHHHPHHLDHLNHETSMAGVLEENARLRRQVNDLTSRLERLERLLERSEANRPDRYRSDARRDIGGSDGFDYSDYTQGGYPVGSAVSGLTPTTHISSGSLRTPRSGIERVGGVNELSRRTSFDRYTDYSTDLEIGGSRRLSDHRHNSGSW